MHPEASLEALEQGLRRGDPEAARRIQQAVTARRDQRGEHTRWGLLCEEAGLLPLAFTEFQLALRDDPADPVAAFHLAQHYRERGDTGRAVSLLERLLASDPSRVDWLEAYVDIAAEDGAAPRARQALARAAQHGLPAPQQAALDRRLGEAAHHTPAEAPAPPQPDLLPTGADCVRFQTLFSGREGVYARQWVRPNGATGYTPVREPLTPAVVRNHLLGTYTVGVYPVRLDGTATFFALDLDIDNAALKRAHGDPAFAQSLRDALRREGPRLLDVLRQLGFAPLFENSGYKGRHHWVFLQQPETAEALHLLGRLLVAWQSPQLPPGLHLEYFPKQAHLKGKGLGNLIKLPLGIHRRTGYRSTLLDDQGDPVPDPFALLGQVERAPQPTVHAAIARLKSLPLPAPQRPSAEAPRREAERAKPIRVAAPPPPPPPPAWTEADFEADPAVHHLLAHCPVLAALKTTADQHRRLSHEEQLVLIHSLGHLESGPKAVNYLFAKCADVAPEKFMKDRLKGNPISCPSIRKKIRHVTRRLPCNCAFEFAPNRYPSPVLHLLTLPTETPGAQPDTQAAPAEDPLEKLAQRFGLLERRRAEIRREWEETRHALIVSLRTRPEPAVAVPGGCYRLIQREGVDELVWQPAEENQSPNPR